MVPPWGREIAGGSVTGEEAAPSSWVVSLHLRALRTAEVGATFSKGTGNAYHVAHDQGAGPQRVGD
jgi:hypothetical protein